MKKIMLSLLTISLIGTTVMPVYAADVYGEETTNLYSYNEGAMYDDDHVTEYSADVEDEKLQQNFEAAINDGIGLSTDDFSETSYSANVDETMQSENEIESLEADFEAAMQDENIKLSEDGIETMNLISTADYNIDTEYAVEVDGDVFDVKIMPTGFMEIGESDKGPFTPVEGALTSSMRQS